MHTSMYLMFDKDYAKDLQQAKEFAEYFLDENDFCAGGFFSNCIADGYRIGGRWSGELTRVQLDEQKLEKLEKEYKRKYGKKKLTWQEAKRRRRDLFRKYFPQFRCEPPEARDETVKLGYPDDALTVNAAIYEKIVRPGSTVENYHDGGKVIDIDAGEDVAELKKNEVIGKRWIVVIDFHY